ncbi:MAG: ADP-ribosylglycohydrolase family protein [Candidatus Parcubacteria bacterium]|nr:ADP-ribosylglycohydrolase family protein [Candidatus Parcubacteria bacterium]
MNRDQVIGMFLGGAIGDALGVPGETMTAARIAQVFGRITTYREPQDHQWYKNWQAGRWTDDTQLTLAIAESLIAKGKIDLADIAQRSITAMNECSIGWGGSTKKSLQRIEAGVPLLKAGNPKGAGNGVAMKVAPFAAYLAAPGTDKAIAEKVAELALMTHQTDMAVISAFIQIQALSFCLEGVDQDRPFSAERLLQPVLRQGKAVKIMLREKKYQLTYLPEDFLGRFATLMCLFEEFSLMTPTKLAECYGGADCYVYNSLPFTIAMFLRQPFSIETLYDTVSAGGDTDSNGSMVAALLGALNGTKIFPSHLIDGLWKKDTILQVANLFCDRFKIE